ncbi:MAG: hypothetical protein FKGGLIKP_00446 [Sodalis sp. Fse]|nr:MAG: hypothetical protein FKGGLIKP_00446 [Sodalis sp. Fse]
MKKLFPFFLTLSFGGFDKIELGKNVYKFIKDKLN